MAASKFRDGILHLSDSEMNGLIDLYCYSIHFSGKSIKFALGINKRIQEHKSES